MAWDSARISSAIILLAGMVASGNPENGRCLLARGFQRTSKLLDLVDDFSLGIKGLPTGNGVAQTGTSQPLEQADNDFSTRHPHSQNDEHEQIAPSPGPAQGSGIAFKTTNTMRPVPVLEYLGGPPWVQLLDLAGDFSSGMKGLPTGNVAAQIGISQQREQSDNNFTTRPPHSQNDEHEEIPSSPEPAQGSDIAVKTTSTTTPVLASKTTTTTTPVPLTTAPLVTAGSKMRSNSANTTRKHFMPAWVFCLQKPRDEPPGDCTEVPKAPKASATVLVHCFRNLSMCKQCHEALESMPEFGPTSATVGDCHGAITTTTAAVGTSTTTPVSSTTTTAAVGTTTAAPPQRNTTTAVTSTTTAVNTSTAAPSQSNTTTADSSSTTTTASATSTINATGTDSVTDAPSNTCPTEMVPLPSGGCIDVAQTIPSPCVSDSWDRIQTQCKAIGKALCAKDQYQDAYKNGAAVTAATKKYGYTATTAGCKAGFHKLMKGNDGVVWGCHSNTGCFPNRYYRCCREKDGDTQEEPRPPSQTQLPNSSQAL